MTLTKDETTRLREVRSRVAAEAARVATLGGWPTRVSPDSLVTRVPDVDEDGNLAELDMGGFDAGVACTLDLIPREKQQLAATLHAAYTPSAVAQARVEAETMDPDSETTWWLAACSVCDEGRGDAQRFLGQLERFTALASDPEARVAAAKAQHADMLAAFEVQDGVAVALRDGGMQGAYLAGHELAGMYAKGYDLWFLGTFHRTLSLEGFPWEALGDPDSEVLEERLGRSGPVFGSAQFVKCADRDEFDRAVAAAVPQD